MQLLLHIVVRSLKHLQLHQEVIVLPLDLNELRLKLFRGMSASGCFDLLVVLLILFIFDHIQSKQRLFVVATAIASAVLQPVLVDFFATRLHLFELMRFIQVQFKLSLQGGSLLA